MGRELQLPWNKPTPIGMVPQIQTCEICERITGWTEHAGQSLACSADSLGIWLFYVFGFRTLSEALRTGHDLAIFDR